MTARRRQSGAAQWGQHATDAALILWYLAVVVFLFMPIIAAVIYSFNLGVVNKQIATLTGWTLQWYPAAWNDLSLRRSVQASLVVALWSALLSIVIGSALGYVIVRHPSDRVRRFLAALTYILLIVPESVIGVSLLLFYAVTRIPLGTATLVAGITPIAIAVVALVVRARVLTLDRRVEEAAADLGSSRLKTLWFIILPQVAPAIAAGGLMAYTFSFDNLVVSSFLTTPQITTLPVYLYGSLQYGPSPAVYAAASVVFIFTMLMLGIAAMLYRLARRPTAAPL
jgi:ABC-type spermidine/putrescine transport system permease subunit II